MYTSATPAIGSTPDFGTSSPRAATPLQAPGVVSSVATNAALPSEAVTRSDADRLHDVKAELDAANRKLAGDGHEVRFEYDRNASQLIVRLVDVATEKVLRQYPSEQALMVARQVISGKPLLSTLA
jgi:uncharacterized FlaG/YvyC family protein